MEGRLTTMEERIGKQIHDSKVKSEKDLDEFKEIASTRLNSHSKDIRRLQGWRNRIVGAAGVLGLVGTLIGALVGRFFDSIFPGRG